MTRTHCGAGHFLTKLRHLPLQPLTAKSATRVGPGQMPPRGWDARGPERGAVPGSGAASQHQGDVRAAGRACGRALRPPRRPRLWPVTPCAATPLGRRSLPGPLHTQKRCRQGDDRVTLSCSRWVPGRDGRCAPGPCSGSSGDPALLAVSAEGQDTDRVPEPPEGAGPGHRVCCPSRAQASRT